MFKHFAELGFNGRQLDSFIQAVGGNFIVADRPVLSVPMASIEHLALMLGKSDASHIYIGGGVFHINALYESMATLPAVRVYYMKTRNLSQLAQWCSNLKSKDIDILKFPILNDEELSTLIEIEDYPRRYSKWKIGRDHEYGDFARLADGRHKNTNIKQSIWLNTSTCFFCKNPAPSMHTVSIGSIDGGAMMGIRVCSEHRSAIESNGGFYETVAKKFDFPLSAFSFSKRAETIGSIFEVNCQIIRDKLDCVISKINGNEITCHRSSGVWIVFRLDAVDNYAYNIFYPNKKLHSRIDSSDHHMINFGPDHIHRKLTKNKKKEVESSYTYGQPLLDYKIILELIKNAEEQWTNGVA